MTSAQDLKANVLLAQSQFQEWICSSIDIKEELLHEEPAVLQFTEIEQGDEEDVIQEHPEEEEVHTHPTLPLDISEDEKEDVITTPVQSLKAVSDRSVTCNFCGKIFFGRGPLTLHQTHMHKDVIREPAQHTHICEVCGKGFSCKSNLALHSKLHVERKRQQCPGCNKYCLRLSDHRRKCPATVQVDKKPCPVCGKEVKCLRSHMVMHRERQFSCDVCEKTFVSANDVQRHMHVHTGERVTCLFCEHQATHKDNSRMHMKNKHPREYEQWKAERQRQLAEQSVLRLEDQQGDKSYSNQLGLY